jgi:hypothetical protein
VAFDHLSRANLTIAKGPKLNDLSSGEGGPGAIAKPERPTGNPQSRCFEKLTAGALPPEGRPRQRE